LDTQDQREHTQLAMERHSRVVMLGAVGYARPPGRASTALRGIGSVCPRDRRLATERAIAKPRY
jgi:hypothetical protein